MKTSLNLIRYYDEKYGCAPEPAPEGVDKLVEKIGAQLGAVEEVIDLGKRYQGIVVARVVSCEKHTNSDHLHICAIDDSGKVPDVDRDENGYVQVVCGAPNVRAGLLVAWLPPGTTVPSTIDKDPFMLTARDIRGQISNGMLGSARELGLGDNHDGILEIDEPANPGDDFAKVYHLDDYIIDIENKMFTHRPDLFGHLGIAREIAGIQNQQFTSPSWYVGPKAPENHQSTVIRSYGVTNEVPELCPRYMVIGMENITIAPSPIWLQSYLSRISIRPINNVVDTTNYMMILTGQPLHAFDFDKVAKDGAAQIIVRHPRVGEKMTLLDGKTIEPRNEAILICDQDKPIALGGIMGGNNSEIDEHTTRILIECANFDMYNIRKTSMEHGLFTDAVMRFNKGQSPWQCPAVLYKAVEMMAELSPEAKPIGQPVDSNHAKPLGQPITITAQFINERLGLTLSGSEAAEILRHVEFVVDEQADQLTITAPFWRTDIEIPEDIVEEVGRLYGYEHLPLILPSRTIEPTEKNPLLSFKSEIRSKLAASGANELLTYSFVHGNLLQHVGQDVEVAFRVSNALSPDLQYYRLSLLPSLLEKVHPNLKTNRAGTEDNDFALFEINRVHNREEKDEEGLPKEIDSLALVYAADEKTAQRKFSGAPYYGAKRYLDVLLDQLHVDTALHIYPIDKHTFPRSSQRVIQMVQPFQSNRSAAIRNDDDEIVGIVGEFITAAKRSLKLPDFCAGFEINIEALLKASRQKTYVALPRYPNVEQDICLRIPLSITYAELLAVVHESLERQKPEATRAILQPVDIYQDGENASQKQITFRLWISAYNRTLQSEEINTLLDNVAAECREKLSAERV